jgi:hypothetical protein
MSFSDDPNDKKNQILSDATLAGSLVGRAIGIAPMFVGGAFALNGIKSNRALLGGGINNGIKEANMRVGENLDKLLERNNRIKADNLRQSLLEGGQIRKMLEEGAESRRVLIGSAIELVDQSDSGLAPGIKDQLLELLSKDQSSMIESEEKMIKQVMESVMSSGDEERKGKARRLFKNLSPYANVITGPAQVDLQGLSPKFNPILNPDDLDPLARSRYSRIMKAAGANAKDLVQLGQIKEGGGTSTYARVYKSPLAASRGTSNFINVPIQLASALVQNKGSIGHVGIYRGGQGTTTYATRRLYGDAPEVSRMTSGGSKSLTQSMVVGELGKKNGAFFTFSEFAVRKFEEMAGKRGLEYLQPKFYHSALTDVSEQMPRSFRHSGALFNKMQGNLAVQQNTVTFLDAQKLTRSENRVFRALLGANSPGFLDTAGDPMVNLMKDESAYFSMSMREGGTLSKMRGIGIELDRTLQPVTAREKQFIGRSSIFSNQGFNPLPGFGVSGTVRSVGQSLDLAADVASGAIQRAHVLDVKGRGLGLGEGEAYMGDPKRGLMVTNDLTKTIVDPRTSGHKKISTLLTNELMHQQQAGGRLKVGQGQSTKLLSPSLAGQTISSMDDFYKVFGGKDGGMALMGFNENLGEVGLPRWAGIKSLDIGLEEMTSTTQKKMLHFSGQYTVQSAFAKVFGPLFKGTVKPINENVSSRIAQQQVGGVSMTEVLRSANINESNMLLTEGSMLKKSPAYLANQLVGGATLITGQNANAFRSEVNSLASGALSKLDYGKETMAFKKQYKYLTSVIEATAQGLAKSGQPINPRLAGMAFAGVQEHLGKIGQKAGIKDADKAVGRLISKHLGGHNAEEIIKVAKEGWALGLGSLVPGPQASEYRRNLGSMEPRTYQFLQHRLQNIMGLPVDTVSDFMTGLLARKEGTEKELSTLRSLTRMEESIAGNTRITEQSRFQKMERVSYKELMGRDPESMKSFLRSERFRGAGGFMLDFEGSGNIKNAAKTAFGHSGGFFVAGGDTIDMMKGTKIPGLEGAMTIENEYVRRMSTFSGDLARIDSISMRSTEDMGRSVEAMRSFKGDMAEIWAATNRGLLRGKLRGSAMAVGQSVSLGGMPGDSVSGVQGKEAAAEYSSGRRETLSTKSSPSWDLNDEQIGRAKKAFGHTKGRAVFAETETFLSAMSQYIAGEKNSLTALGEGGSGAKAAQDAGTIFERFFTGMESDKMTGVDAFVVRDPQLGPGHIAPSSIFRHAAEVGYGADDAVFKAFTATEEGNRALARINKAAGKNITSFADISNMEKGTAGAKKAFFTTMAQNITKYSSGEGGARLLFPNMQIGVHYGQKVRPLDMSIASGMIGDFDGDLYKLIFPGKNMRKMIHQKSEEILSQDIKYRAHTRMMVDASKEGLENLGEHIKTGQPLDVGQFAYQEAIKERIAKDVGRYDVALDQLRMGLVGTTLGPGDVAKQQQAMSLLTAVEEVGIKAKKLGVGLEVTEAGEKAINQMIRSGGESTEAFEAFIRKTVFRGTDLEAGKMTITGIDTSDILDVATRKKINNALVGTSVDLSEIMQSLKLASSTARETGVEGVKTMRRLSNMAKMDSADALRMWQSSIAEAGSVQGQMMAAGRNQAEQIGAFMNRGSKAIRRAQALTSTKMMGPLALGAVASIGVGSLLGDSGYSPTPIIQPGEFSDAKVNASIMSGTATDRHIQPNSLPQQSDPEMLNRPINLGQARMQRNNAYRMRGEIVNRSGMSDIMSMMSRTGSSGSIVVNDTRRPITAHQINRIMED